MYLIKRIGITGSRSIIKNPNSHTVEVKGQLCDYCHQNPMKYMVAGRFGKSYELICQVCYDKQGANIS